MSLNVYICCIHAVCFRLRPCTRLWGLAHISVCCSIYIFSFYRHNMAHKNSIVNLLTLYAIKILKILTEIQQKGKWDRRKKKEIINRCRQMRKKSCWSHSHKFIYFHFLLNVFPITVFAPFYLKEKICVFELELQ